MVHTNIFSEDKQSIDIINKGNKIKTVEDFLNDASDDLRNKYSMVRDFILSLGDDVQEKKLKHYFGF